MQCQVEECTSEAVNWRIERNELEGDDRDGERHIIQTCIIKTPLCEIHSASVQVSTLQNVEINDL